MKQRTNWSAWLHSMLPVLVVSVMSFIAAAVVFGALEATK